MSRTTSYDVEMLRNRTSSGLAEVRADVTDIQVGDVDSEASTAGQVIVSAGDGTARWDTLVTPRYGGISVQGNTTDTAIPAKDTWYQVAIFDTDDPASGATPDHTNDHVTIDGSGDYGIMVSIDFTGTGNNVYEFQVKKNNGATSFANLYAARKVGTTGDVGSCSMSGIVALSSSDTVELWVQNTSAANKDATVYDCSLAVFRLSL